MCFLEAECDGRTVRFPRASGSGDSSVISFIYELDY
jgi:hypothetical protein